MAVGSRIFFLKTHPLTSPQVFYRLISGFTTIPKGFLRVLTHLSLTERIWGNRLKRKIWTEWKNSVTIVEVLVLVRNEGELRFNQFNSGSWSLRRKSNWSLIRTIQRPEPCCWMVRSPLCCSLSVGFLLTLVSFSCRFLKGKICPYSLRWKLPG